MDRENYNRKLTALLSADVVGYSRMMGSNETATLYSLTVNKSIMAGLIRDCCGRIVDSPGDNLLAEFPSAVAAVECAVKIQKRLKERNSLLPSEQQMTYRIGVNLGDVIEEEGRLYGDCVNITSRLQTLALPGSVCISGFVFDQVTGKQIYAYKYLGRQKVKNIDRPVRVYRLVESFSDSDKCRQKASIPSNSKTIKRYTLVLALLILVSSGAYLKKPCNFISARVAEAPAEIELPAIAVLPFKNLSQTAEFEKFTDALTDDIITNLSQLSGLSVVARNSVFTYKNKPTKTQVLSRELNAQFILEGSLRRVGDQILINAQLINSMIGFHVWAERYDLKIKDLMAVELDITTKIAAALNLSLNDQDRTILQEKGSDYFNAYMKKLEDGEQKLQPEEKDLKTEMIFWESVKDSDQPAMYEEYLRIFPDGIFSGLAKLHILKLMASTSAPPGEGKSRQATSNSQKGEDSKTGPAEKLSTEKRKTPDAKVPVSEEAWWRSIQNSIKAEEYEQFLSKFPDGTYSGLAWIKIDSLSQTSAQPQKPALETRFSVAIFDEKAETLYHSAGTWYKNADRKTSIAKGIKMALNTDKSIIPKWSAYDLGKEYDIKPPENIIAKSMNLNNLWIKDTETEKEIPNVDMIRRFHELLQVDAVMMIRTYSYSLFFTRSHYYLVELDTGRLITHTFDAGYYGPYDLSPIQIRNNILKLLSERNKR